MLECRSGGCVPTTKCGVCCREAGWINQRPGRLGRGRPADMSPPAWLSHTPLIQLLAKVKVLVTQLCLTLCDPLDCSPPGSSVYGILQARILEWVAIPFSRGSSWPRDPTQVSCIAGRFWATSDPFLPNLIFFVTVKLNTWLWALHLLHFLLWVAYQPIFNY